jgi:hypothetical protein
MKTISHFEEMSRFLLNNREKYTINELKNILGFKSRTSIVNRLRKLGIKIGNRKGDLTNLLHENLISYYWIGFILADGHITKSNQLVVVSANKDKLHLEKLAYFLNGHVKECKRSPNGIGNYKGSEKTYTRLAIQDKILGNQLKEKFDISNQKTYIPPRYLSRLDDLKLLSLIIGFIDGDGSVTKYKGIKIECHSSWREVLLLFKAIIEKTFLIPVRISLLDSKYCSIHLRQELFYVLKKFAMENGLPIMERKWLKFD